ncbi:DUF3180 family protein [Actinomycetota bacterium]
MVRRGLTWPALLTVALTAGLVSWVGWTLYTRAGNHLFPLSWAAAALLLILAALVLGAALPVRRYQRGEVGKPLSGMRAARILVLAQAASLTGAAAAGWYAGQLPVLLADLALRSYRALLWPLLGSMLAGVLLVLAGMLVQRWCRVEPRDDDED